MCPINGTGYGITSTNITKSLHKLGVDISLYSIGGPSAETPEDRDILLPLLNNARFYNNYAPCLKIWHQHDLSTRIGRGPYYVYPFFELDKLLDVEVHQINQADGVFTASGWGKYVLENSGVRIPVFVAPLGADTNIFNNNKIRMENSTYVFFHIGKWEKRKGQDFLIEAFNNAFTAEDDVSLWLSPSNPFLNREETEAWMKMAKESPLGDKITIFDRFPTQGQLAEAINASDCGIFLSRAEGWNNEIPEMMAMNKPIIATNYSAHTEYLTESNSFLVNIQQTEPAVDGKWFKGDGHWAKLGQSEMEQTIEHMRFVYNNNIQSNPNGVETAKRLSWENTASIIRNTMFNQEA